jgi:geranylgeranyl diphosphate synthase type II
MVGTDGMIAGQIVDLESSARPIDAATLEYIESHKTGALIVGAVRIAAVLAGAKPADFQALTDYARNFGVAYQVCDDILHLTRRSDELGKLSHRDEATVNYARTHGIDESRKSLASFCANAVDALSGFDARADRLRGLARFLARRAS